MSAHTSTVTARAARRGLRRDRVHWPSLVFQTLLAMSLLFTLLALLALLADVLGRGLPVLAARGVDFLTSPLSSDPSRAGVAQALWGTFWIGVTVVVVALPLGIATAVYLEEYAGRSRVARLVDVNIRNLAGVPSIVYGLLGLAVFAGSFKAIGAGNGRNVIAGGLTVAALVLPIVIITSAEAIRTVPDAIREAGYGVGATRWQVTARLVVPAAFPGIMTGVILSLSRALGETAPLILAGAVLGSFSSGSADLVGQLLGPYTALPMVVYRWTTLPQAEFRQLAAAGMVVLLVITFAANGLAIHLRNRRSRAS